MADSADGARDAPGGPVIVAQGVTKRYGSFVAVRGLDLEVTGGTIFGFVGPSGSGKTTTVRLATGSQRPTSGSITVFGRSPAKFTPEQRARMGYMPQLSVLYPQLSLAQNLNFVASIYGLPLRRRRRLRRVLDLVELTPHRRKRLRNTSGGMQRRLALAAALVHDPELVFLDEPTAGVDPVLRRKFWEHFAQLRQDGRTLFVTTQYVGEAAHCDRIGVITDGRLLVVDTAEGLRRRAYGGQILDLVAQARLSESTADDLTALSYVSDAEWIRADGRALRVVVDQAARAIPRLQQWFTARDVELRSIREHVPELDDVFVELVRAARS
ncbi:MAG: ATP-binding cassette domain-containing protein [Egibacteraceae bacterium]